MAYHLLCFAYTVLISFSISQGKTINVKMCESGTTTIDEDSLKLDAVGPRRSQLTTNTSKTCSCTIYVTNDWYNSVSVQFSRTSGITQGNGCNGNVYDKARLDFQSNPPTQSVNLQNEDLSNFDENYDDVSTIKINITIHSICGSNYTIQLKENRYIAKLSYVTCSNPETVVTSSFTTPSPTSLKTTGFSMNSTVSAYSSNESTSESPVAEKSVLAPSKTGLIVGVVVGVGGGLLLLGAIVLAVVIFRRRRAKPQPLTNTNQNTPTEHSYEPTVEYASVSYEELRNSTQLQNETPYDNQTAATDPLDTESGQNYYNLQGNVNSLYHHSDSAFISDQTTSSEVDNFVRDPHSINDTDTTVIENDLYEK